VQWYLRYVPYHRLRHPAEVGGAWIVRFCASTHASTNRHVAENVVVVLGICCVSFLEPKVELRHSRWKLRLDETEEQRTSGTIQN